MNLPVAMSTSRILIVEGDSRVADGVERVLRHDLPGGASIVRAHRIPGRTDAFDAAVVVAGSGREPESELPDLPVIVVDPAASAGACAEGVRRGIEQVLSDRCATCTRQPALATAVLCAIERFRRARRVEEARRRERRAALHDPLTGLPNVRLYRERLRQLLAQGRRTGKRSALLFLDLDRFKEVNDTAGHAIGDRLLRRVAARIRSCIRETDTVARRGGDEFVVLLDDVREPADALAVAREILGRISRPTAVLGAVVRPSASVGIAVSPEDGTTAAALEAEADRAMYRAKELGGNVACTHARPDTHFAPPSPGLGRIHGRRA